MHCPITQAIRDKWNRKTKPEGSLGRLESLARRVGQIQGTDNPQVREKRICVFAADHGVTAEGVSAFPKAVTREMVANFQSGGAAINVLAKEGGIDLAIVDVGIDGDFDSWIKNSPKFYHRKVGEGTRNLAKEPAMTVNECAQAMEAGREQARHANRDGVDIIGIGEMGIGNSSSAAALFAALFSIPVQEIVGRGTGIDEAILAQKQSVVRQAVARHSEVNQVFLPQTWLAEIGGFEIAAMAGLIVEAAHLNMPVVVDGFISTAAAAAAFELTPETRAVCFFSHISTETGHRVVLDRLGADPILDLEMRLGEGTGAALAIPILQAATRLLADMATFESAGVSNIIPSGN